MHMLCVPFDAFVTMLLLIVVYSRCTSAALTVALATAAITITMYLVHTPG